MKCISYPLARGKQIILLVAFITQAIILGQTAWAASRSGSVGQNSSTSPAIIGEVEAIANVESLSNYQIFRYPGANYVKVHFRQFYLQAGDYVTVSNAKGTEKYTYPGDDFTQDATPGFWALSITGDTAIVRFHAASSAPMTARQGFQVDKVAHGYPPSQLSETFNTESICGESQHKNVVCYDQTLYGEEHDKAHAVAKLLINMGDVGMAGCTAWRIGPDNRMLTNHHCFTNNGVDIDENFFKNTEVLFNYQSSTCGSTTVPTTDVVKVTTAEVLVSDVEKDFVLFTVNNFSDIQEFGYLDVDPRIPEIGEIIYIPQHPNGFPKQFGIESDTGRCQIDVATINGIGADTDTGYTCDTFGGSSGAPVIIRDPDDPNRDGKVIALHHFGVAASACNTDGTPVVNQAVRMEHIWPMIETYMSPTIQFEAATYQFVEGAGSVEIPVKYTGENKNPASATYTIGDTGVEHSDYIQINATNNVLTWGNDNSTSVQSIPLTILDDDVYQGNRTVSITLSDFNGAEGGVMDKTAVTIVENDIPVADNVSNLCRTPNLFDYEYIEDSLVILEGGVLQDLNVKLNVTHSWVGDMDVTLEHVGTGTQVSLFNRPYGGGCNGNDLNLIFDDAAFSNVQQECQNDYVSDQAYQVGFSYQPYEPLSQFNGETLAGTWTLKIHDNDPTIDDPTLIEWCLLPEEVSNTVLLEAVDMPSSVCPGESFDITFQMTIPTEIIATQVALKFDPAKLKATHIAVNHAIMNFMLDDETYDNETGTLHFTAALFESSSPAAGTTFPLFTVTFEALQASESTDIVFDTTNTFTVPSSTNQGDKLPQTSEDVTLQLRCQPDYRIELEGRSNHQTSLLIEMLEDNGNISIYNSATNEQGQGQLPVALLVGGYTACAKAPHTLKKKLDFSIPTPLIDFDLLTAGDINDDNKVDLWDFVLLYRGKHACQTDSNYDARADFDGDGCIELADALLLKANYDKVGESCQATVPQSEEVETTRRSHDIKGDISLALPADLSIDSVVEIPIIVGADIRQPVNAVTAYLTFDPQKIEVSQVIPGTHLDFTLQNSIDEAQGEIKIVATLWDNAPVEEDFTLATLVVTPRVAESIDSLQFKQTHVVAAVDAVAFEANHAAPATCQLYATSNSEQGSQLFTVDVETHLPKTLGAVHANRIIRALAIHHDTDHIYAVVEDRDHTTYLYQVDGQTGALSLISNILFDQIVDLAFSPNGTLWAWAQGSGLIEIKPMTGESHIVLPSYSDVITVAGLTLQSKGDATTFFGAAGHDLWQYDMDTNALTLACANLLKETESLETIVGSNLLLFGAQSDPGFGLRILDVTTCQDVVEEIMLPEAFQSVDSFALPTAACIEKLTR
jgi:subtilisin-like proprotein convertase family protein